MRENVWEIEVTPQPHRVAWWVVRPVVALLFLSIIGIPFGVIFAAAAAKPWKEHKAWKQARKRGEY